MPSAMETDSPVALAQKNPKRSRSGHSEDTTTQVDMQVDHIIFDTDMYAEGCRRVHAYTCAKETPSSTSCTFGDWKEARVLLWGDEDNALHVTVVETVC